MCGSHRVRSYRVGRALRRVRFVVAVDTVPFAFVSRVYNFLPRRLLRLRQLQRLLPSPSPLIASPVQARPSVTRSFTSGEVAYRPTAPSFSQAAAAAAAKAILSMTKHRAQKCIATRKTVGGPSAFATFGHFLREWRRMVYLCCSAIVSRAYVSLFQCDRAIAA